MKIKHLALALSLAGLGVLQQVTAVGAVVFNFSGGGDSGSLDVTTNMNNAITAITGTINNQTVTGLYTGTVDYNPEFGNPVGTPSGIFPVDNLIAFNGSNILTTFNGFAVNTSNGSIYNLYTSSAPNGGFGTLDSIGTLNNAAVLVRDNSAAALDFPNNSNLPGITATAVPAPPSTLGLLVLGALGGGSILKKKLAKLGTKNRSNEKMSA